MTARVFGYYAAGFEARCMIFGAIFFCGSASAQIYPAAGGEVNVTSSAAPAFDTTLGTLQRFSITVPVTSSTLDSSTTPGPGQRVVFFIANATSSAINFMWPSNVKGGTSGLSSIAASGTTVQAFVYDSGTGNWFPEGPFIFVP